MTNPRDAAGYEPNPHYTQEDWDEVCDNPELTEEELAAMRPASEVLPPELYKALVERGRAMRGPAEPAKVQLDRDVLDHFQASGPGWQSRINEVLRRSIKAG